MTAFKQFSMALLTMLFVAGLLFDILNRDVPKDFVGTPMTIDDAKVMIEKTVHSTFSIDRELATPWPR